MAEEQIAVAEPQAEEQPATTLEERGFGNIAEAFDKVFPSTAEKQEEAAPPPASAPPPEPAKAEEVKPPPVSAQQDELPDFLTGEKKAEETKPTEDLELPPPTGKESLNVKQFREKHQELIARSKQREQELLGQIEALKQAPPQEPDAAATIAQQQKQIEQLSAAIERTNIEQHPAFQREFVEKRVQLVNDAHQILTEAKVDPVQWDKAQALVGQARTEALEELYADLPKSTQAELGAAAREIRSLDARREAVLADRKGLQERLTAEEQRERYQALQQHEKRTKQMLEMVGKELAESGFEVFKKSDDPAHAKWNESVDKMNADAERILLETTDPKVMAMAAKLAPAAIQYRYLYQTFRDKYLEERKKNEAISAAEPTLQSRGEAPATEEDDKLSFADAAAKAAFSKI